MGLRGGAVGGHGFGITADAADTAGEPPGECAEHGEVGGEQVGDVGAAVRQCPHGEQEEDAEDGEE